MRRTRQVLVQALAKAMFDGRKERGLTQAAVAGHIGISQGALSKMERGLLVPSAIQWVEFCRLTKVRVDGFMPASAQKD
jgi:transcriptional regulator with XRE-family HTH domain